MTVSTSAWQSRLAPVRRVESWVSEPARSGTPPAPDPRRPAAPSPPVRARDAAGPARTRRAGTARHAASCAARRYGSCWSSPGWSHCASSTITPSTSPQKLSTLSRDLQGGTEGTLHAIVQAATGTVPGAEYASISAVDKHNASAAAAPTSAGCSSLGRTAAPVSLVSGVVRCRARLLGAG